MLVEVLELDSPHQYKYLGLFSRTNDYLLFKFLFVFINRFLVFGQASVAFFLVFPLFLLKLLVFNNVSYSLPNHIRKFVLTLVEIYFFSVVRVWSKLDELLWLYFDIILMF